MVLGSRISTGKLLVVYPILNTGASPAGRGRGGYAPPIFVFASPIFFLPPHGIFLGGKKWCFWAEKTFKFVISARKSLRILAKTFLFWRSPAIGRKICDFGQKKPSHFGENLCPPDFNFAPPPQSREAGDSPD